MIYYEIDVVGEDVVGEEVHSTHSTSVTFTSHGLFKNIFRTVFSSKFHSHSCCSNCSASSNILSMSVTADTSQLEISLLKTLASENK